MHGSLTVVCQGFVHIKNGTRVFVRETKGGQGKNEKIWHGKKGKSAACGTVFHSSRKIWKKCCCVI